MIQRAWNEPILGKLYPLFPQPWLWWGVSSKSDLLQRSKHWWFGCKGQASSFTIDIRPSTAAQVLNTLSMRGVLTKAPGHSKSEGMWSSSPCESAQNVPKGWNWDPKNDTYGHSSYITVHEETLLLATCIAVQSTTTGQRWRVMMIQMLTENRKPCQTHHTHTIIHT